MTFSSKQAYLYDMHFMQYTNVIYSHARWVQMHWLVFAGRSLGEIGRQENRPIHAVSFRGSRTCFPTDCNEIGDEIELVEM